MTWGSEQTDRQHLQSSTVVLNRGYFCECPGVGKDKHLLFPTQPLARRETQTCLLSPVQGSMLMVFPAWLFWEELIACYFSVIPAPVSGVRCCNKYFIIELGCCSIYRNYGEIPGT